MTGVKLLVNVKKATEFNYCEIWFETADGVLVGITDGIQAATAIGIAAYVTDGILASVTNGIQVDAAIDIMVGVIDGTLDIATACILPNLTDGILVHH